MREHLKTLHGPDGSFIHSMFIEHLPYAAPCFGRWRRSDSQDSVLSLGSSKRDGHETHYSSPILRCAIFLS